MSDSESFADVPVALAEKRAERDQNASSWTPRDALVSILREIDSGRLKVDLIWIGHAERQEETILSSYLTAGGMNQFETSGMIEVLKTRMITDARE